MMEDSFTRYLAAKQSVDDRSLNEGVAIVVGPLTAAGLWRSWKLARAQGHARPAGRARVLARVADTRR